MINPAPGWYHGSGDPTGTVRYWDGTTWTTEPLPAPPDWRDPARPSVEYGSAWRRFAAAWIDGILGFVISLPVSIGYFRDVFDEAAAGGDATIVAIPPEIFLVNLAVIGVYLVMVAVRGGTPGKLMLGLRITLEDSTTTPPGFGRAARRAIPNLIGIIPVLGGVVGILVPLASFVMVLSDDEHRSVYDRVADTRVIRVR